MAVKGSATKAIRQVKTTSYPVSNLQKAKRKCFAFCIYIFKTLIELG